MLEENKKRTKRNKAFKQHKHNKHSLQTKRQKLVDGEVFENVRNSREVLRFLLVKTKLVSIKIPDAIYRDNDPLIMWAEPLVAKNST